jgi:hypothetical protein
MALFHNLLCSLNVWLENKISQIGEANLPPETDQYDGIEKEPWIRPSDYPGDEREGY